MSQPNAAPPIGNGCPGHHVPVGAGRSAAAEPAPNPNPAATMAPEVNAPATMCLISLVTFMLFPLSVAAPRLRISSCLLIFDARGNFPASAMQSKPVRVATDPNFDKIWGALCSVVAASSSRVRWHGESHTRLAGTPCGDACPDHLREGEARSLHHLSDKTCRSWPADSRSANRSALTFGHAERFCDFSR